MFSFNPYSLDINNRNGIKLKIKGTCDISEIENENDYLRRDFLLKF